MQWVILGGLILAWAMLSGRTGGGAGGLSPGDSSLLTGSDLMQLPGVGSAAPSMPPGSTAGFAGGGGSFSADTSVSTATNTAPPAYVASYAPPATYAPTPVAQPAPIYAGGVAPAPVAEPTPSYSGQLGTVALFAPIAHALGELLPGVLTPARGSFTQETQRAFAPIAPRLGGLLPGVLTAPLSSAPPVEFTERPRRTGAQSF